MSGVYESQPPRLSIGARVTILVLLVAGAIGLGVAIRNGLATRVRASADLKRETSDAAVATVSVVHPKPSTAAEELALPGNMQAFVATPIFARTSGYLKKWYFDIGSHVKTGDLLAEIETPEIDRQLDQARAELATAQANLHLAETTAARYQGLLASESVAKQDVEDKVGDMQAKRAIVDSANQNVRRLEETQRFQKVYAPFGGAITARNTDIGALIDAGANSPGKELFDLAATDRLRVFINVPQTYSRTATPGRPADLTLAEFPGRHFRGAIARTSESIDPASRTLLTEVDVDNATGELLPGAFVTVHFQLGGQGPAVILPANTLIFRSGGLQVAVVRDGRAVLTTVTPGRDFGNEIEVVSGVTPQDAVVENPSDSLTSGAVVRVTK
jgi:RND family efflux transporter MFP subunit